ncbi:patatin family protein [Kineosporia babensis]
MRGVYSIGALAALEDAGLREAFSVVVGSSAGAINGAYFLAGQANEGLRIYVEELSHRAFINPRRLWRVVDVDHLIDGVLKGARPLDVAALHAAPIPLLTVLTDAATGAACTVSSRDSQYDLYEVLRATAALPALYNKRIRLGGDLGERRFIDGGIVAPVPVEQALALDGVSEAVVVMTRSFDFKQDDLSTPMRMLGRMLARGQKPFVKDNISRPSEPYAELLARLKVENSLERRSTWTMAPSSIVTDRTTIDASVLEATAERGRQDLLALLEQEYRPISAEAGSGRQAVQVSTGPPSSSAVQASPQPISSSVQVSASDVSLPSSTTPLTE